MTFLAPASALVAAALALPALLLFYFLRLRRRVLRVSSTMLWESASHDVQVNVPWQRLRPSWLLVLQLLALLSLLLALARPTIVGRAAGHARTILLLDRSASMQAQDTAAPGGASSPASAISRFDAAKARARELVDRALSAGASTQVAVVAFAGEAITLSPLTSNRRVILDAIDACTPSDQPGDLQAALSLCGSLLAGDADESQTASAPGLVVLLSDGTFSPPTDRTGFTLAGGELRYEPLGPRDDTTLDNLAITALAARPGAGGGGERGSSGWRLFARIQNASNRPRVAPLLLTLDNAELRRETLEIPGASGETPGERTLTLELPARASGLATLAITRSDSLASDNQASVALAPSTRSRVLLVVPSEASGPDWVIADVLRELPETTLRIVPASAYEASDPTKLGADLVIFDRVIPRAARALPPVPSIHFGRPPTLPGLTSPVEPLVKTDVFVSWLRTHPVLRDVVLDAVEIAEHWPVTLAPGTSIIRELAQGRSSPLILEADDNAVTRLIVAFEPVRSTWPLSPSFAIFLASAAEHLASQEDSQPARAWTTRDAIDLRVAAAAELTLDGADTRRQASARSPGIVSLGRPERAGVYTLQAAPASATSIRAVPVNLADPLESAIRVAPRVRVSGTEAPAATADADLPRELWHWLIMLAGALLTLEWWLSGRWMRV